MTWMVLARKVSLLITINRKNISYIILAVFVARARLKKNVALSISWSYKLPTKCGFLFCFAKLNSCHWGVKAKAPTAQAIRASEGSGLFPHRANILCLGPPSSELNLTITSQALDCTRSRLVKGDP